MRVRELMTSPPITCHVNDPLSVAAQRMWDADVGAILVVNDDGKLTGIITDRDVCMAAYTQGRALDELLVNSAMARHIVTATPQTTVTAIGDLMAKYQVRRIPVVDEAGKPVGLVSINDLARASVKADSALTHGASKLAHTLAEICQHRADVHEA